MKKTLAFLAVLALPLAATQAQAAQVWPFQFNPDLDSNPTNIQLQLTLGAATLPTLPVSELQTLTTDDGGMTLWLWPENATLLQSIWDAGPNLMTWPTTPVTCVQHAAFSMPTLLDADGGSACDSAATQIEQAIVPNLPSCMLTEQPELYVLSYSPSDVAQDVDNIEDMIGLAGQALSLVGPPLQGILPTDFVPTTRSILDKIRYPTLLAQLQAATAGYAEATSLLADNAGCFDPTVVASLTSELAALSTEIASITSYLQQLEQQGEAAHAQEDVCLAAGSRVRETLPYPGLTQSDREFVAFWLGGIYWRMRGGALIPLGSTQEARTYYAEDGFAQIGALLAGQDGTSVGLPFFTELATDGWSQWMSMGTNGSSDDKYADLIGMTERGQRQAEAGVQALQPLGYETAELMTGGLQMGPGYYYAYYPLMDFRYGISMPPPYSNFIDYPTAIGEFNMGAALGLGMARSLLYGKASDAGVPDLCAGLSCGSDGCGGTCGTCTGSLVCNSGQCGAPIADAGPTLDAGIDAGTTGVDDAGLPQVPDAGADAGHTLPTDAGTAIDGGAQTEPDTDGGSSAASGCGCAAASAGSSSPLTAAFLGLAVLLWRSRRRAK